VALWLYTLDLQASIPAAIFNCLDGRTLLKSELSEIFDALNMTKLGPQKKLEKSLRHFYQRSN